MPKKSVTMKESDTKKRKAAAFFWRKNVATENISARFLR
jgi:hypothetical protein